MQPSQVYYSTHAKDTPDIHEDQLIRLPNAAVIGYTMMKNDAAGVIVPIQSEEIQFTSNV